MGVLVLIPNLKGGLTVAARIWEFAALSLEFEEPHLGVFDNLRKGRPFSARLLDRIEYCTSKLSRGALLQLSDDPYHREFVS